MGSTGRIPPHHMRRPLPGHGMGHPEPFGAGIRPPHGGFPPMDMLPPPEVLEQKLASQHVEMERLATENRRLATTHGTLRQHLAAAQQELQILESQIGGVKSEREQQMRGLVERISKMEAELRAAERLKMDLQKAHTEAQSLAEARQELISKVQQLSNELQRAHVDVQQIPALLGELNHLKQEFHQCRGTYDHERKVYLDHVESLQVMDKEYRTMAEEVAKLRAELNSTANADKRAAYGPTGYGENDASGYNPSGQGSYEDGYGAPQVHAAYAAASGGPATAPVAAGGGGGVVASSGGTPTYGAPQSGPAAPRAGGYDGARVPGYEAQRAPAYDPSRGPAYDPQGAQAYNPQRVAPGYDAYRGGGGYEMQRAPPPYDPQRAYSNNYDAHSRGAAPQPPPNPQGQVGPNNAPYGAAAVAQPPAAARAGGGPAGHEAQARGGNTARR